MREILFRGKTQNCSYQENDKWIYGYYVKQENKHMITVITRVCLGFGLEVDENTVGQFTGLTDKNGKKIYEGDIVKYETRYRFDEKDMSDCEKELTRIDKEVVKFDNGSFSPMPTVRLCEDYWYSWGTCNFEVIGNIHDNPELLGE